MILYVVGSIPAIFCQKHIAQLGRATACFTQTLSLINIACYLKWIWGALGLNADGTTDGSRSCAGSIPVVIIK